MDTSNNNIMERRAIPDLLDKRYIIPQYQRGYRWDEHQVLDLLDDLNTFFTGGTKGQFYCLQPIVVKKTSLDNELWYEVIDGQQRLTTLRIIMQVFDQINRSQFGPVIHHGYAIRYATRPDMEDIFNSISVVNDGNGNPIIDDSKNRWNKLIDSVYIYNSAKTILKWFFDDTKRISTYSQYFYNTKDSGEKSVQVVWYETVEKNDPHDIFNRMNSMKVELSCSELIRSLFLSSCTKFDLGDDLNDLSDSVSNEISKERFIHRQTSINEKWDEIEQQMRNKDFQSFLTRRNNIGRNAIELLFDLMSAKYASNKVVAPEYPELNKKDSLYTYLHFKRILDSNSDAWLVWEKVLNAFEKLQYWYHDRSLYHHIGFLNEIADKGCEDNVICSLLSITTGKQSVLKKVYELISLEMVLPVDNETKSPIKSLEKLSYDNSTHYKYIKKLLLLYNVETTLRHKSGNYFSFNKYRYSSDGVTERLWTLEHIHAQNSDCLPETNKDSWLEWIQYNLNALRKMSFGDPSILGEQRHIIAELEDSIREVEAYGTKMPLCKTRDYTFDSIKALFEDVVGFYSMLDSKADKAKPVHQLSNMALLDLNQNAMVGKSAFEVKRQIICEKLADDEYYPICTRKVFLKLYDPESTQIHSWSQNDRIEYYSDIKEKLTGYIDKSAF